MVYYREKERMDHGDLIEINEGKGEIKKGLIIMGIISIIYFSSSINIFTEGIICVFSYLFSIIGILLFIDGIRIIHKRKKKLKKELELNQQVCNIINHQEGKGVLNRIDTLITEVFKDEKPLKISYLLRRYCLDRKGNFELNSKSYYIMDIKGMNVFFYDGRNKIYDLGYGNKYVSITLLHEFGFCDWLIEKGFIDCDKLKKGIQWENYNIKNVGNSLIYNVNTLYYNLFLIDAEHIASFDYNNGTNKKFEYLESLLY